MGQRAAECLLGRPLAPQKPPTEPTLPPLGQETANEAEKKGQMPAEILTQSRPDFLSLILQLN